MDVQAALLAAIADRPGDDTPRLAYADWLDDHAGDMPDPDAARFRAEFIRVQVAVKQFDNLPSAELQGYADLYRRQDALLTQQRREVLGGLADVLGPHDAVFDRGFLLELGVSAEAFLDHGEAIASLQPLPDVSVTASTYSARLLQSPHCGIVTGLRWESLRSMPGEPEDVPWPRWQRLRLLNLSGCELTDSGLAAVASIEFAQLPALTDLDVSWNEITDEGIESLVRSPLWPQLRVLVVGSNPITDAGANHLADAPTTSLRYLHIARTAITPHGQQRLLRRKGWKVDLF